MRKKILSLILSFVIVLTVFVPFTLSFSSISAGAVSYTADSSWYDANASVLEINDIPDFIAFMEKLNDLGTTDNGKAKGAEGNLAAISWTGKMPFEGQTVILNTDIVLNPGVTFSESGPSDPTAHKFIRTDKQIGFGGIFDGRGHTVSGLYISAAKGGAGSIFGVGGATTKQMNVVVRNLQIKNSLIENSNMGVATVFSSAAFDCHVLIQNVYSEAILKSSASGTSTDSKLKAPITGVNMGGLCATVGGDLTIDSSIFAGKFVTSTSGAHKKYVGGLVGNISNKTLNDNIWHTANLTVENSAYYGTFSGDGVFIGKLAGSQTAGSVVTVNNSIFGGTMKSTASFTPGSGANGKASTYFVGRLIGETTSNYTIKVTGTVATPSYKGSTAIKADYNSVNAANSGTSISIKDIGDSEIKGEKSALGNGLDLYWISNGTLNGYPVPMGYIMLFGRESLKYNYLGELPITANDLFDQLGVKLVNEGIYTEKSYRDYSEAYDEIVAMIFADGEDLSAVNVPALKQKAEALLRTPLQAKKDELHAVLGDKLSADIYTEESYSAYSTVYDAIAKCIDDAVDIAALEEIDVPDLKAGAEANLVLLIVVKKAELLEKLGEKIKNTDNKYTEQSYEEYSALYDDIVEMINSVSELSALNSFNVMNNKFIAESKLVLSVVDIPESEAPATEVPTEALATESEEESHKGIDVIDKKGCGSSLGIASVTIVSLIGAAGVMITKKRR